MTENEAIKIIGNNATEKEIILETLYQLVEKFNRGHWGDIQLFEDEENRYSTVIEKAIEEIQQYRELGTVEELKKLKEKQIPKKPREWANGTLHCPNEVCEFDNTCLGFDVCVKCGQKLDWE